MGFWQTWSAIHDVEISRYEITKYRDSRNTVISIEPVATGFKGWIAGDRPAGSKKAGQLMGSGVVQAPGLETQAATRGVERQGAGTRARTRLGVRRRISIDAPAVRATSLSRPGGKAR